MSEAKLSKAYDRGFQDGLTTFAWWRDGEEQVGTTGTTLKAAIEGRESLFNYDPPQDNDQVAALEARLKDAGLDLELASREHKLLEERLEGMEKEWHRASSYSIKLQQIIEAFAHGRPLPHPELWHHKMLLDLAVAQEGQ